MNNIDKLINNLTHPNHQTSEAAKLALLSKGHEIVEPLLKALPHTNAKGSWEIINILARLRDHRAVPAVSEYLYANNGAIRSAAAQCLGEIGDQQATEPLLKALQENKHCGALVWIVQALGRLADHRALDTLITVMQETDSPAVRYTAIEALGIIGDKRAIEPIKQYLNDPSHHVHSRVEMALVRLGAEKTQTV